ncbi:hypothetical protein JQK88_33345 [Mesorhizobium caraganae]|uniref:hypothetical protein n=1 Tax=Mesorhizobium caraganae TaxID=483206 RepID=UPI00193A267B|nr:hypothetical protein [Mesorhizobium caraganae]MBM2715991.1 hypothetical protein [Mesorhizobium caraganae]
MTVTLLVAKATTPRSIHAKFWRRCPLHSRFGDFQYRDGLDLLISRKHRVLEIGELSLAKTAASSTFRLARRVHMAGKIRRSQSSSWTSPKEAPTVSRFCFGQVGGNLSSEIYII